MASATGPAHSIVVKMARAAGQGGGMLLSVAFPCSDALSLIAVSPVPWCLHAPLRHHRRRRLRHPCLPLFHTCTLHVGMSVARAEAAAHGFVGRKAHAVA